MRILLISTFPPRECGIATYVYQSYLKLKKNNKVDILTFEDCDGKYKTELKGGFNILKILKYAFYYDKLILNYEPFIYYDFKKSLVNRIFTRFSFFFLFLFLKNIEIIIHEFNRNSNKIMFNFQWFFARNLIFHTKANKDEFNNLLSRLNS